MIFFRDTSWKTGPVAKIFCAFIAFNFDLKLVPGALNACSHVNGIVSMISCILALGVRFKPVDCSYFESLERASPDTFTSGEKSHQYTQSTATSLIL